MPDRVCIGELSGMDGDLHEMSEVGASVGASEAAISSVPVASGGSRPFRRPLPTWRVGSRQAGTFRRTSWRTPSARPDGCCGFAPPCLRPLYRPSRIQRPSGPSGQWHIQGGPNNWLQRMLDKAAPLSQVATRGPCLSSIGRSRGTGTGGG
jgi:hypothetical protein